MRGTLPALGFCLTSQPLLRASNEVSLEIAKAKAPHTAGKKLINPNAIKMAQISLGRNEAKKNRLSFLVRFHPLMLPSTCSREALLACPLSPPWNLPSFTVECTLFTPCSRSNPPLSLAKVRLSPTLTLSPFMI